MLPFELSIPTRIHFGIGIYASALKKEVELLQGKVLLVTTGRSLYKFGYVQNVYNELEKIVGVGCVSVFDKISANPKIDEVKQGIAIGKGFGANLIVGFGGGSSIDAAKAIAVGIGTEAPIEDFLFDAKAPTEGTLPIIAIPTTAGTGSELSQGAIITCQKRTIKTGIRGKEILPTVAIVDPEFTLRMPLSITMETGFDVFAHAVESYISKQATSFSEMLSLEAIHLVVEALPVLRINLQDKIAREKMSYASMLMGINLAQVGTALPHRMQYPVGAHTDTSHAAGLLALYPAWVSCAYPYCAEKFNKIATILSNKKCVGKEAAISCFEQFIKELGVRKNLLDLGLAKKEILQLSDEVTGNISTDFAAQKTGIMDEIYCMAME
jgi:Alcohol dehydrogenase, class IV